MFWKYNADANRLTHKKVGTLILTVEPSVVNRTDMETIWTSPGLTYSQRLPPIMLLSSGIMNAVLYRKFSSKISVHSKEKLSPVSLSKLPRREIWYLGGGGSFSEGGLGVVVGSVVITSVERNQESIMLAAISYLLESGHHVLVLTSSQSCSNNYFSKKKKKMLHSWLFEMARLL